MTSIQTPLRVPGCSLASPCTVSPAAYLRCAAGRSSRRPGLALIRPALPMPISARLDSTLALLDRVVARASALNQRSNCVTITSGIRDELGLLPASDACRPAPVDGTSAAVPLPSVPALPAVTHPAQSCHPTCCFIRRQLRFLCPQRTVEQPVRASHNPKPR